MSMLSNTLRIIAKCSQSVSIYRCTNNIKCHIPVQNYSKVYSRAPIAVLNEDEIFGTTVDDNESSKENLRKRAVRRKRKPKKKEIPQVAEEKQIYTKLEENERLLCSIMMKVKSRSKRKKNDQILLEGHRYITDAMNSGMTPELIIFTRFDDLTKIPCIDKSTKCYKVSYKTIQLWSSLTTSPGIVGIFPTPVVEKEVAHDAIPLEIVCDNIRDPGNLGSVLRAAASVGCQKVILTKGCVDLWESKVLRSAAGAHFRIPIYSSKTWNEIREMINEDADVFAADNNVVEEELNMKNDSMSQNLKDSNLQESDGEEEEKINLDAGEEKTPVMDVNELRKQLPVVPYHLIDYRNSSIVIIIGGETEGLSKESLSFLYDRNGARINIPLHNGIESLNTSMALGIISYEVHRQYSIASDSEKE